MTVNDYQQQAMLTLNREIPPKDLLVNAVMGLCGESGECGQMSAKTAQVQSLRDAHEKQKII